MTRAATTVSQKTHKSEKSDNYTDPKLRERLKKKILAGDKGGDPGEWSARKAQLLTKEYEKTGGGYKSSKRTEKQTKPRAVGGGKMDDFGRRSFGA
jgi:hypothetical protein